MLAGNWLLVVISASHYSANSNAELENNVFLREDASSGRLSLIFLHVANLGFVEAFGRVIYSIRDALYYLMNNASGQTVE